jgi:hypothetical protein
MWSSNHFFVFKPNEKEMKGPITDRENNSDAESGDGEDGEKQEAINQEPKKDFQLLD